jgi:hypothetical protein
MSLITIKNLHISFLLALENIHVLINLHRASEQPLLPLSCHLWSLRCRRGCTRFARMSEEEGVQVDPNLLIYELYLNETFPVRKAHG